ncbi:MAG TPA: metal-sensitive transcriptional regulator [Tissierellia bacterium]|jgi:DNA-binding FrmR family transcriptional regulator|nr:metal-sensitive transcriptional regulator [Tissierellia bacterium]
MDKKKDIINRLKTLQGHIGGIEAMVEKDESCDAIMLQLRALSSSLKRLQYKVLSTYVDECLEEEDGKKKLLKMLDYVGRD